MTPKEFELLAFLAQNAGTVVSHSQILTAIWGAAHAADIAYLRVHMAVYAIKSKIIPMTRKSCLLSQE